MVETIAGKLLATMSEVGGPSALRRATIDWTRKPNKWADITTVISANDLLKLVPDIKDDLDYFETKDLLEFPTSGPMDGFLNPTEQYFILKHKGKVYLINTEGKDYAQYAVEVTDTEVLDL